MEDEKMGGSEILKERGLKKEYELFAFKFLPLAIAMTSVIGVGLGLALYPYVKLFPIHEPIAWIKWLEISLCVFALICLIKITGNYLKNEK